MISSYLGRLPEYLWGHQTYRLIKEVDAEAYKISDDWPAVRREFFFSQIMRIARAILILYPAIAGAGIYMLNKARVRKITRANDLAKGILIFSFAFWFVAIPICNKKISQTTKKLYSHLFRLAMESHQNFSSLIWNKCKRYGNNIFDLDISNLKNRALTNEGLTDLAEACPNLESLSIDAKDLTENNLKTLAHKCPNLKEIKLINFNHSANCKVFKEFKKLRVLNLHAPHLTHEAFTNLPLKTLSSLMITAPLSRKSLKTLTRQQNRLRTVKIFSDHLVPEDFKLLCNQNFRDLRRVSFKTQSSTLPSHGENPSLLHIFANTYSIVNFFNSWETRDGDWIVSEDSNQNCSLIFEWNKDD